METGGHECLVLENIRGIGPLHVIHVTRDVGEDKRVCFRNWLNITSLVN